MGSSVSKERSSNYLRQIKGSIIYKAVAVAAAFLAIPLMIKYLGQEQFGVWSTMLSIISWMVFFDLGIGNGLRNKVAEALARNDRVEAGNYIASGFTLIGIIAGALWVIIIIASFSIPWQTVFNTEVILESTLRSTVQITGFFIALNFWLALINVVLGAVQKSSWSSFGQAISNLMALLLIYILVKTTEASIVNLSFVSGVSLVIANGVLGLCLFKKYPELKPRIYLDRQHIRPLFVVGMQFFVIQLAFLVIYTTDKILITQLLGPQYVTQYEVVFKLFSLITLLHAIISLPLWSAYTDAFYRRDIIWIDGMLKKQKIVFLGIVIAVIVTVMIARPVIALWIGTELDISFSLVLVMGAGVLITVWGNIYAMLVNGIGKIKVQTYTALVAMLINVPLVLFFVKYLDYGVSGVVLATCVSLLVGAVVLPVQVHYEFRNMVQGCD